MAWTALSAFTKSTDDRELITEKAFWVDVGILNNNADITLFVMSEPGDIEYILVRHEGTAPSAGTIRFYVAPSGTALGSGSALGAAEDGSGLTASTTFAYPITGNNTGLAAGTAVGLLTASTLDNMAEGLSITVGIRKGGYRTTDAGTKFYPVASPNNF